MPNMMRDPAMAAKQQKVVEPQLRAMREGHPCSEFSAMEKFLSQIPLESPASLLDAGCGSAYYSEVIEYFAPNVYSYVGVDFNLGMVELAHRLYPELRVVQMDLHSLEFPDHSIDVVLSGACIIHIEKWKVALAELVRVARLYLILHRNPIWLDESSTVYPDWFAYDVMVKMHRFNEKEFLEEVLREFRLVDQQDISRSPSTEVISTKVTKVTRSYLFERRKAL